MRNLIRIFSWVIILSSLFFLSCDDENNKNPEPTKEILSTNITEEKSVPSLEGSFDIVITSNLVWEVTSSEEWLTTTPLKGMDNATISCSYKTNTSTDKRSGTITIAPTSGDVNSIIISVSQVGENDPEPDILETDINDKENLPENSGNFDVVITSNVAWETSSSAEWLTTQPTSGSGNTTISCSYQANTSTEKRSGIITISPVSSDVNSVVIPFSQAGIVITTPQYSNWAELPVVDKDNSDLHYAYHIVENTNNVRNYSVCYSESKRCPVWVASPMHDSYRGDSGRTDAYKDDPEIDCTQGRRWDGYTRGHMLGSNERTMSISANEQVFYHSNIGPQLGGPGFNTGGGVWNNLEEYTNQFWCADTLYMVNGCHWEHTNTIVDGTTIPTHYYKVMLKTKSGNSQKWVVDCTAQELQCVAFLVKHSHQKGVKPNKNQMMSVSDLEKLTGFTYFENVPNAPKNSFNASDWNIR